MPVVGNGSYVMSAELSPSNPSDPAATPTNDVPAVLSWSARYGERHRLVRIADFPPGIAGPKKVRIYRRQEHYVLQWWDPAAKATLSDRIDGDLVAAIMRARQIEERLVHFRRAGHGRPKVTPPELVDRYLTDLRRRADGGDVTPRTVDRLRAALRHLLAYADQPAVARRHPHAGGIDRDFRLGFAAFLAGRSVSPNGHANAPARPLKGQAFILDSVRAMLEWAVDPDRGNLLPDGFRNPFLRSGASRAVFQGDPLAEPDVTLAMAVDFVRASDRFQLRLFAPVLLFGLRAGEPCFLLAEHLEPDWLRVPCLPELAYQTKGRRDKRFPLPEPLRPFWQALHDGRTAGPLYRRRAVLAGTEEAPWQDASREALMAEFRRRCAARRDLSAAERLRVRDRLWREAGGLSYDHVEHEFGGLARRLGWRRQATLKDFRHLFCTMLGDAALPEGYRRYLMGHAPGKAAVVAYTHLSELRRHFETAVRREWQPLVEAILARLATLTTGDAGDRQPG